MMEKFPDGSRESAHDLQSLSQNVSSFQDRFIGAYAAIMMNMFWKLETFAEKDLIWNERCDVVRQSDFVRFKQRKKKQYFLCCNLCYYFRLNLFVCFYL